MYAVESFDLVTSVTAAASDFDVTSVDVSPVDDVAPISDNKKVVNVECDEIDDEAEDEVVSAEVDEFFSLNIFCSFSIN